MITASILLWTLTILSQSTPAAGPAILAKVRPGPVFIGQGVEVTVGVFGLGERPKVTVPVIDGASITFVGGDLRPISTSAIGDQVSGKNFYRYRYRVIPRRAGALRIPPFVSSVEGKPVASTPLRLNVKTVPAAGRTAEFLGGVGAFEVDASAVPSTVRRGQAIDYQIEIRGPAAAGIMSAPVLDRLKTLPLGIQIERKPDVVVAEPPSHTFVYALRPTLAGDATLPPVRISSFDPETARFVTRVTPGIAIQSAEVPTFDPKQMSYPEPLPDTPDTRMTRLVIVGSAAALIAAAALILGIRWRRSSRERKRFRRRIEAIRSANGDRDLARVITAELIDYLSQSVERDEGALTPLEAEGGVLRAKGSAELAEKARAIAETCDAVLYGEAKAERFDLRNQSLELFEKLAKKMRQSP